MLFRSVIDTGTGKEVIMIYDWTRDETADVRAGHGAKVAIQERKKRPGICAGGFPALMRLNGKGSASLILTFKLSPFRGFIPDTSHLAYPFFSLNLSHLIERMPVSPRSLRCLL